MPLVPFSWPNDHMPARDTKLREVGNKTMKGNFGTTNYVGSSFEVNHSSPILSLYETNKG